MYSNRDKIAKKGEVKPTEIEDEVAKTLFELENSAKPEIVAEIKQVKLAQAQYHGEGDNRILQIMVPFPVYAIAKKHYTTIVPYLEGKFKCPVVMIAQRTILSKYEKRKGSQKRPRSRTLAAVHEAYLNDIVLSI